MKKFLLIMTAVVAVSLTGCDSTVNYKAEGEKMATRLDKLCEAQDARAAIALDDSIRNMKAQIAEKNDTLALRQFNEALKETRTRTAPIIAAMKVKNGADKEKVIEGMKNDVLNGDISIEAVTNAIDQLIIVGE